VSPIEPTRRVVSASTLDDIACRLWAMEWRVRLDELRGRGLAIVEWHPDTLLETVLAPLSGSRPRWAAQR
jgi:hypothetical protein